MLEEYEPRRDENELKDKVVIHQQQRRDDKHQRTGKRAQRDIAAEPRDSRRNDRRPGYEGMGLGLFIARALLEGSGARIRFDNAAIGAKVTITWPIARVQADDRAALRQNPQIG